MVFYLVNTLRSLYSLAYSPRIHSSGRLTIGSKVSPPFIVLKNWLNLILNCDQKNKNQCCDRFAYVWNTPLMNFDPSGEVIGFIIAEVIFGVFNAAIKHFKNNFFYNLSATLSWAGKNLVSII